MLAAHDDDTRCEIFELVDFMSALHASFNLIKDLSRRLEVEEENRKKNALKKGSASEASHSFPNSAQNSVEKTQCGLPFDRDSLLKLKRAFLESFVYLSIHKEFKEQFIENKAVVKAFFTNLITNHDIRTDGNICYAYCTVVFNFFRSRDDKIRPRKKEYPYTELCDEEMEALEEFYKKMPQESRPVANGVVDAGDAQLAFEYRRFFATDESIAGTKGTAKSNNNIVVSGYKPQELAGGGEHVSGAGECALEKLNQCAVSPASSSQCRITLGHIYQFLCSQKNAEFADKESSTTTTTSGAELVNTWRRMLVQKGGVHALLRLHDSIEKACSLKSANALNTTGEGKDAGIGGGKSTMDDSKSLDAVRQTIAQILIVTNPAVVNYHDIMDCVVPLIELSKHNHELLQFEAAMALTNLASFPVTQDKMAKEGHGWSCAIDLLFSENERIQRAALELMQNLAGHEAIAAKIATKCQAHSGMPGEDESKVPSDLKILLSFCSQWSRAEQEEEFEKEKKEFEIKLKEQEVKFKKDEAELEKSLLSQAEAEVKKQTSEKNLSKKQQEKLLNELKEKVGAQVAQQKLMNAMEKSKLKSKQSWNRKEMEVEDVKTQMAACGALACLTQNDETGDICKVISLADQFTYVVDLISDELKIDPGLQHRAVVVMVQVLASDKVVPPVKFLVEKHLGEHIETLCPPARNTFEQFLQWREKEEMTKEGVQLD